jgi:hypothetical protein
MQGAFAANVLPRPRRAQSSGATTLLAFLHLEGTMVPRWTPELGEKVSRHMQTVLDDPQSHPPWKVEAIQRTNGLPAYADLGGVIVLTATGVLLSFSTESKTTSLVEEELWNDVALASLGRLYPDLSEMLPPRPTDASICKHCSGSGWIRNGRLFCRPCRGRGWLE